MLHFPLEILPLIVDQLEYQRDFETLFACALTGKLLVKNALKSLYGIHNHSRIFCSDNYDSFEEYFGIESRSVNRFNRGKNIYFSTHYDHSTYSRKIILWKSIILSSIKKTAFPYCLYIRSLDLDELETLIRFDFFRTTEPLDSRSVADMFDTNRGDQSIIEYTDLCDKNKVVELVGDCLISYISRVPRAIAILQRVKWCDHENRALIRWTSQLPKLETLVISSSTNLEDIAKVILHNCPKFKNLMFFNKYDRGKWEDQARSHFLKELRKNTLRKLLIKGYSSGLDLEDYETLLSLNFHAESLRELKISRLSLVATDKIHLLSACKALTSLQLSFSHLHNGMFQAIVDWICDCRSLHELSLGNSNDGKAILTQVCCKAWIRLQKLEILTSIKIDESEDFLKALSSQTTLEYLCLRAENPNKCSLSDTQNFINCLGCLTNLRYLDIDTNYGYYPMDTVISLVSHFTRLEEFFFKCHDTTDSVWPAMSNLHHLRALTIEGLSYFTFDGVLAFIDALHATNEGFELSILESANFTTEQISIIAQSLHNKVGGCLENI